MQSPISFQTSVICCFSIHFVFHYFKAVLRGQGGDNLDVEVPDRLRQPPEVDRELRHRGVVRDDEEHRIQLPG